MLNMYLLDHINQLIKLPKTVQIVYNGYCQQQYERHILKVHSVFLLIKKDFTQRSEQHF